jgi:hypothetical protein
LQVRFAGRAVEYDEVVVAPVEEVGEGCGQDVCDGDSATVPRQEQPSQVVEAFAPAYHVDVISNPREGHGDRGTSHERRDQPRAVVAGTGTGVAEVLADIALRIEIDEQDPVAGCSGEAAERRRETGLSYASLAVGDRDHAA